MITAQRPVVLDHACPNPRCCVCDIDADWIGEGVEIGVWPNITPSRDTYRTCDEYHLAVQPDWPPVPQSYSNDRKRSNISPILEPRRTLQNGEGGRSGIIRGQRHKRTTSQRSTTPRA